MQEKCFQNRITLFTFALTILVIWVHSVNLYPSVLGMGGIAFDPENAPALQRFFYHAECFFTETLGQTAVPGFFMVSAYLFFRKADRGVSPAWFLKKWKSRVFTLFVPFLLWNFLYYLADLSFAALSGASVTSYLRPQALFSALWEYAYNPVFWYLQELILLTLLTPLLFVLLKHGAAAVPVLAAGFLLAVFWARLPFHIVNEDALFYYMLGVYAALHQKKRIERGSGSARAFLWAFLLMLLSAAAPALLPLELRSNTELSVLFTVAFRAAFPLALYFLLTFLSRSAPGVQAFLAKGSLPAFMQINFFIYATHYVPTRLVNRIALRSMRYAELTDVRAALLFLLYLLLPLICVAAAYGMSVLLRRYLPGVYRVLTGGR